jgi:adenylate cyclase, class 2
MREIERKILDVPKRLFLKKMRQLAAVKQKSVLMRVVYFDFPDGRIKECRDLLRTRELIEGKKRTTELVYKTFQGIEGGCKIFDEREITLKERGAFQKLTDFFQACGYVQTVYFEKKRIEYKWRDITFEFDQYPQIPSFLEIEGPNAQEVKQIIKKLGLEEHEQTPESINQLMERKYPQVTLNGLHFS